MMHYAPMKDNTCLRGEGAACGSFCWRQWRSPGWHHGHHAAYLCAVGPLICERERGGRVVPRASHRAVCSQSGKRGHAYRHLAREHRRRGLITATGHGVGFVGVIHEGPQGLSAKNDTPFEPGMTVTDEPGIYEEGKLGVRIENELLCVPVSETEYGASYGCELFTYCPIDTRPLKLELMTREELEWLDRYHAAVLRELGAYLNKEEGAWLEKACAPVAR